MTQIQLRRDTAANWASVNPVLASGEPAFETDTGKFKIGDGTTAYNSLDYIGAGDLPDNITTQGNTFNGANQLVQLDSTGKLPAVDGSQLTNLPGGSAPTNMVTTNTDQTITGAKTFTGNPFSIRYNGYQVFQASTSTVYVGTTNSNASTYAQVNLMASENGHIKVLRGGASSSGTTGIVLDTRNFSTVAPTGALKYWTGTEAAYTELGTKDADTLYRTTDTNKVYLGTIQLGS